MWPVINYYWPHKLLFLCYYCCCLAIKNCYFYILDCLHFLATILTLHMSHSLQILLEAVSHVSLAFSWHCLRG